MEHTKKLESVRSQSVNQARASTLSPSAVWLRVLVLIGGIGLLPGGLASAEIATPPEMEDAVGSVANSGTDPLPSSHRPTHVAGAAVTLVRPAAVAPPEMASQPPAVSPSVTPSPPPASSSMYSPVPPPPPAAITITIPAPERSATMADSLLRPTVAAPAADGPAGADAPAAAEPTPAATPVVPAAIAADESVPAGYNSVFIDPTDYSLGATQAPVARPSSPAGVVFAERGTGCQIAVGPGQSAPTSSCAQAPAASAQRTSGGQGEIQIGPVAVSANGVRLGSTTIVSREALNEKLRPLNVLRRGNEDYVFPLSVPASISSLFGWRMHPVHQSWRFHSGTDLAAPMGTPVLATRAGRVSVSDFLGGYGLTVILRHEDGNLESRYAHLSQLAVEAGEWVEQGEVIGLVGSTGTSTGPHLHFELRQLTAEGWVAVDPIEVLEYGVANLLEILDNPLLALGRSGDKAPEAEILPSELPFRPAQPNAS